MMINMFVKTPATITALWLSLEWTRMSMTLKRSQLVDPIHGQSPLVIGADERTYAAPERAHPEWIPPRCCKTDVAARRIHSGAHCELSKSAICRNRSFEQERPWDLPHATHE